MIVAERGGQRILVFPELDEAGLECAISTRPINIRDYGDRDRFLQAMGVDPARVVSPRQIHRARVARITRSHPPGLVPEADGLVTDVPGMPLLLRAADCSLIVVADPIRRVVGAAHAGWKGSARGIVVNLLRTMHKHYGVQPRSCLAGVGPTIRARNYPVGPEVPTSFLRKRPWARGHIFASKGKFHFDLAGANVAFLRECGVPAKSIDVCELCTFDHAELLHSFRRDGTDAGHQGMLVHWPER